MTLLGGAAHVCTPAAAATANNVRLVVANDPDADRLAAAEQVMNADHSGSGNFVTFSGTKIGRTLQYTGSAGVWQRAHCACGQAVETACAFACACSSCTRPLAALRCCGVRYLCPAMALLCICVLVIAGNDIGLLLADWVWQNFRRKHPEVRGSQPVGCNAATLSLQSVPLLLNAERCICCSHHTALQLLHP